MGDPICPYCNQPAECVPSTEVYKKFYGMLWLCRKCKAYVGCHKGTSLPLGTLANSKLRGWRSTAHYYFDQIWKDGFMFRQKAYGWLAEQLGIPEAQCHIGMFDVYRCKETIRVSQEKLKSLKSKYK